MAKNRSEKDFGILDGLDNLKTPKEEIKKTVIAKTEPKEEKQITKSKPDIISISIQKELNERLKNYTNNLGYKRSISSIICEALADYLNNKGY